MRSLVEYLSSINLSKLKWVVPVFIVIGAISIVVFGSIWLLSKIFRISKSTRDFYIPNVNTEDFYIPKVNKEKARKLFF